MTTKESKDYQVTNIVQKSILGSDNRVVSGLEVFFTIEGLTGEYSIEIVDSTPTKIKSAIIKKRDLLMDIMDL